MSIQSDLDLAMEQMDNLSPLTLGLYAYAALKLLQGKSPKDIKNGSIDVFISDSPAYSEFLQREVTVELNARITLIEKVTGV